MSKPIVLQKEGERQSSRGSACRRVARFARLRDSHLTHSHPRVSRSFAACDPRKRRRSTRRTSARAARRSSARAARRRRSALVGSTARRATPRSRRAACARRSPARRAASLNGTGIRGIYDLGNLCRSVTWTRCRRRRSTGTSPRTDAPPAYPARLVWRGAARAGGGCGGGGAGVRTGGAAARGATVGVWRRAQEGGYPVRLAVYDLSHGWAKILSPILFCRRIPLAPHTSRSPRRRESGGRSRGGYFRVVASVFRSSQRAPRAARRPDRSILIFDKEYFWGGGIQKVMRTCHASMIPSISRR